MNYVLFIVMTIFFSYLFFEIQREKRRNRIMQSFIAGLIKSVSDYTSRSDMENISTVADLAKIHDKKFPIPYSEILRDITHEFEKDFWVKPYWKWVKKDRSLFYDDRYANDGFNMIYWDFHDSAIAQIKKEHEKESESLA